MLVYAPALLVVLATNLVHEPVPSILIYSDFFITVANSFTFAVVNSFTSGNQFLIPV